MRPESGLPDKRGVAKRRFFENGSAKEADFPTKEPLREGEILRKAEDGAKPGSESSKRILCRNTAHGGAKHTY